MRRLKAPVVINETRRSTKAARTRIDSQDSALLQGCANLGNGFRFGIDLMHIPAGHSGRCDVFREVIEEDDVFRFFLEEVNIGA